MSHKQQAKMCTEKKQKEKEKKPDKTTKPDIWSLIHPPKKRAAIKLKAWKPSKLSY